jgi:hypothetical protein
MGFILTPGAPKGLAFLEAYPCESMAINYKVMVIITLNFLPCFYFH